MTKRVRDEATLNITSNLKQQKQQQLCDALQYKKEYKLKLEEVINIGKFPLINKYDIYNYNKTNNNKNKAVDDNRTILLYREELELVEYIKKCSDNGHARTRKDLVIKVVQILKSRKANNLVGFVMQV